MVKAALVIGLSMGRQYASWLEYLGYKVVTVDVDPDKKALYTNYEDAVRYTNYDIIYIGTPNWTHEPIARHVAKSTRLLIIEKPGIKDSKSWKNLLKDFPDTRIMMVKNNQYRLELSGFKELVKLSSQVIVKWSRKDGIPQSPWFVDKSKSFGGVSRDLMTHLLSYYTALSDYQNGTDHVKHIECIDGTNVDYNCELSFFNSHTKWKLIASWKNDQQDEHYIEFKLDSNDIRFELGDYVTAFGGCPASPYMAMIKTAMDNIDVDLFWQQQQEQDIWIHEQVEKL